VVLGRVIVSQRVLQGLLVVLEDRVPVLEARPLELLLGFKEALLFVDSH